MTTMAPGEQGTAEAEPPRTRNAQIFTMTVIHTSYHSQQGINVSASESSQFVCLKKSKGILLALLSGFFNALYSMLVKLIKSLTLFEIAFYRYAIMIPPLVIVLAIKKTNPFGLELVKTSGMLLFFRAAVGAGEIYAKYYALQKLPLSDASVILFCSPVFASILGRIFLKEKFTFLHILAIIFTFLGCVLVSRPTAIFGNMADNPDVKWDDRMWGCLSALASALCMAIIYVSLRRMKEVESVIILFWTALVGLIFSTVVTLSIGTLTFPSAPIEISALIVNGVFVLISHDLTNRALRIESAGLIAILRTGDIIWSFIWQIAVFGTTPHYLSVVGAVLVVLAVFVISFHEVALKMPEDSAMGKILAKLQRMWNRLVPNVFKKGTTELQ